MPRGRFLEDAATQAFRPKNVRREQDEGGGAEVMMELLNVLDKELSSALFALSYETSAHYQPLQQYQNSIIKF